MSAQIPDAFASAFNPVDFDPNAFDPAEAFNSMFELMDGMSNAIIIQVAMDEELAPFLKVTEELQPSFTEGAAVFHPRYLQVGEDQVPLLLVRSKIGLVNAASAVTEAISYSSNCLGVISAGTAGGLARGINVGDVLIGENYTYTDADATAFGYARGQVPGMPRATTARRMSGRMPWSMRSPHWSRCVSRLRACGRCAAARCWRVTPS